MNTIEIWKKIPNYPRYAVSSHGRFKNTDRILSQCVCGSGYLSVMLCQDGNQKRVLVHKLVALVFIGARPDGAQINHKDSNKKNNVFWNLEYTTGLDNIRHGIKAGTIRPGFSLRKLTDKEIQKIRALRATHGVRELAEMFGIHKSHVSNLCNNKRRKVQTVV